MMVTSLSNTQDIFTVSDLYSPSSIKNIFKKDSLGAKSLDIRKRNFELEINLLEEKIISKETELKDSNITPNEEAEIKDIIKSLNNSILDLKTLWIDKISRDSKLQIQQLKENSSLSLNGNISLNPSDGSSNLITPEISATYKGNLFKSTNSTNYIIYDVNLQIKAPIQSKDTNSVFTNIMKAGSDGFIDLGLKTAFVSSDNKYGFTIRANTKFNWFFTKNFDSTISQTSAFGIVGGLLALKLYPVVVASVLEYNFQYNSSRNENLLLKNIDNTFNVNILIGLLLDNYQILIKYLLYNNKNNLVKEDERFEIKFGVKYDPF